MAGNLYGLPEMQQLLGGRGVQLQAQHSDYESFYLARSASSQAQSECLAYNPLPSYLSKFDHLYSNAIQATTTSARFPGNANVGFIEAPETDHFWAENGSSTSRWPRQETLTLLEVRSRLDPSFKEANQKAPLWDEVSRIMREEYGYQRSGRKCREKFENLYKYYKKTKEGKGGRQDGKKYRFFRQLEAIYGEGSNQPYKGPQTDDVSICNTSDLEASTSESKRKCMKMKIKDYVEMKMRKMMETQDFLMTKLIKMVEEKEIDMKKREEEWMKNEAERLQKEQDTWRKERAWMEARDVAFIERVKKHAGSGLMKQIPFAVENVATARREKWSNSEVMLLVEMTTAMEGRLRAQTGNERHIWEEIAGKMAESGYSRTVEECRVIWETMRHRFSMKRQMDGAFWDMPLCSEGQIH